VAAVKNPARGGGVEHAVDDDAVKMVADSATMAFAPAVPPLRKVAFKAGKKERVATVAKRYGASAGQVTQWHEVDAGALFKAGQTVVVYTPTKPVRVASKQAPRTSVKGRPVAASPSAPVRLASTAR
jgi:membrane-bound lytic murein transglycosylase D